VCQKRHLAAKNPTPTALICRCVTAVGANFENLYFTRWCSDMFMAWWDLFNCKFPVIASVKEFLESVNIWWKYELEYGSPFFDSRCRPTCRRSVLIADVSSVLPKVHQSILRSTVTSIPPPSLPSLLPSVGPPIQLYAVAALRQVLAGPMPCHRKNRTWRWDLPVIF